MILSRLLRSALKACGIVDSSAEPTAEQYEDTLEALNSMLRAWTTKGHIVYHIISEQLAIVQGTASYTIGTGGTFNTPRPNRLVGGYLRDSSNTDSRLEIIARNDYNEIVQKNAKGRPGKLYYYPAYPLATIKTDYVPDQNYTLFLDSLKPLSELLIANLDAAVSLPPEYEETIKYNLAVRLCVDYSIPPRPDIAEMARDTYKNLTTQPVPRATFRGFPGISNNRSNIDTGQ